MLRTERTDVERADDGPLEHVARPIVPGFERRPRSPGLGHPDLVVTAIT